MKIFIMKKSNILRNICIVLTICIICILNSFNFKTSNVIAKKMNSNSIASVELKNKIEKMSMDKEKIAYLTFDDGPNPYVTPKILDILKAEDVKATFFVIGKNVEKHPEIVKREYEEGHYIANHGYSHNNYELYKSEQSFINEVRKTDTAIGKAIGENNYCSHVFRFPNGYMSYSNKGKKEKAAKLLKDMDYEYIDWNCLNNDSIKKYSKTQLLENLKKTSKNKNELVILMHDTKDVSDSSVVLEDSIKYLKMQGYEFENFYDLIEDDD